MKILKTSRLYPWISGSLLLGLLAASVPLCTADPPAARLSFASERPAVVPVQATSEGEPLPEPRELGINLAETSPVLPPCQTYPLDLCTALKLAEQMNPTIGISRQVLQEALANQLRANALLLPTLRAGTNYHLHNGVLQSSFGEMRVLNSASLYAGGGARTLAAETVAFPMVQIYSPLADAFLEPLVARQYVNVRQAQVMAVSNQVLLEVTNRFLELVTAEAEVAAIKETEQKMNVVVDLTARFGREGLGRAADASRARANALLLHTEELQAEEHVAIASANLAEVLNLDTAVRLQTPGQGTGLLQLMDLSLDPDVFVRRAQVARPELAAAAAEIARRQAMVRQEQFRPFLPTLSVGFSSGTFGGYTNRSDLIPAGNLTAFAKFAPRVDFDVIAYFTAQNLGAGNIARANERRVQRDIAVTEQVQTLNLVRREVVAAFGRAEAGWRRLEIARQQLTAVEASYREDLTRVQGLKGLPIEIINSVNRLVASQLNLIRSYQEYNLAQMQLFVAVGRPPLLACVPPPAH
jgi:outer membrane protein TolC